MRTMSAWVLLAGGSLLLASCGSPPAWSATDASLPTSIKSEIAPPGGSVVAAGVPEGELIDAHRTDSNVGADGSTSNTQLFAMPDGTSILVQLDWSDPSLNNSSELKVTTDREKIVATSLQNGVQMIAAAYGGPSVTSGDRIRDAMAAMSLKPDGRSGWRLEPQPQSDLKLVDESSNYAAIGAIRGYQLDYQLKRADGSETTVTVASAPVPDTWTVELAVAALAGGDEFTTVGESEAVVKPGFSGGPTVVSWIAQGQLIRVISGSSPEQAVVDAQRVHLLSAAEFDASIKQLTAERLSRPLLGTAETAIGRLEVRGSGFDDRVVCFAKQCAPMRGLATLATIAIAGGWAIVAVFPANGPRPEIATEPKLIFKESVAASETVLFAQVPGHIDHVDATVSVNGVALTWTADRWQADT